MCLRRSRLRTGFFIIVLPVIILAPCVAWAMGVYFSNSHPIQRYPQSTTYGLSAPKGIVRMNVVFLKTDLGSRDYELSFRLMFYTNQTPNSWIALCSDICRVDSSISANRSTNATKMEQTSDYSVHYSTWWSNITTFGGLPHFSPYSFPIDYYSTDRVYISLDSGFRIDSVDLESSIPSQFIAFFEDIGQVKFSDLPSELQHQGFATGLVLRFSVGMARSPADLLISFVYTIFPILSIYEVGVLSFSSVSDRKDRLTIYVGALFSVFAYFLILRQLLPPLLTILEAVLAAGMVLWVFVEGFLFLTGRN